MLIGCHLLYIFQDPSVADIINCLTAKKPPTQYPESIRNFALTLHSLSPRGYGYVRKKFNQNLPHPSTIRAWFSNSHANGEPGISKESIETLKNLVEEYKEKGMDIYCTCSFDEMSIRRNVQWCDNQKKFNGNISYGSIPHNSEYLPVANNVIVFMVNGININFNLPVAFHFINCLQAHEKAALVLVVLRALTEIGLKIIALVFDGLISNFTTCTLLGACFDTFKDFRPYIINPISKEKVYIFLDAPHMLKLIRNCIGTWKKIYYQGNVIEWKYFEILESLGRKCDVVTHKLTKEHIQFTKNKMNVSLATQLLSRSCATSMEELQKMPQTRELFRDCTATVDFTRRKNDLFDVFNSKTDRPKNIFKSPIRNNSKEAIFTFLDETVEYIKELADVNGRSILKSKRKTGFIGFIINVTNLKEIYENFVETGKMIAIPTQYLNQDPLENFFGRIRSCLGSNTNPTVEQFCAAYRKTLVNVELTCSTLANCADQLNILQIPSTRKPKVNVEPVVVRVSEDNVEKKKEKKTNNSDVQSITDLLNPEYENLDLEEDPFSFDGSDITVQFLSRSIEQKIMAEIRSHCSHCLEITKTIFNETDHTLNICKIANKHLRAHAFKIDFCYNLLIECIEKDLEIDYLYMNTDFTHEPDHKLDLIRFITEEFIRIRATYVAKKITLNEKKKILRRKNLKHFAGQ